MLWLYAIVSVGGYITWHCLEPDFVKVQHSMCFDGYRTAVAA